MQLSRAYQIDDVKTYTVAGTAVDVNIGNRVFMISNTGAQPVYFLPKNKGAATAANAMLVPAGTVFPQRFSCDGNLSVISNATGTTIAILFLDV